MLLPVEPYCSAGADPGLLDSGEGGGGGVDLLREVP